MKVEVTIGNDEIREAVREWMESHGIPNVVVDTLKISGRVAVGGGGFNELADVRVKVAYEADSLSPHEARPLPEPIPDAERPRPLKSKDEPRTSRNGYPPDVVDELMERR